MSLSDGAGHVAALLQRVAPEALDSADLLAESGFESDELRDAIKELEDEGLVEGAEDGYRYIDTAERLATQVQIAEPQSDAPDSEEEVLPDGPGADTHFRVSIAVLATFGKARGDTDDAASKRAQAIAVEAGNVLAAAMPNLHFHVEVQRLEAFDKPRQLWPPPSSEESP